MVPTSPQLPLGSPPSAPPRPFVHREHGVERDDPFEWMRHRDDPELLAYLNAERAYYDTSTAALEGLREQLVAEMVARVPRSEESVRWREGDHLYFTRLPAGAEYPQLRRTSPDLPDADGDLLLDEVALAEGHAFQEVGVRLVSPDGRMLAYSVDHAGDERYELRFRDLTTGSDLPESIPNTYYTGAWDRAGTTFFYTVQDEVYRPFQVWRHEVGTPVTSDVLVREESDEQFELTVQTTRSGEWITICCQSRNTSEVWLIRADAPTSLPMVMEERRRGIEYAVDHVVEPGGRWWLVLTNDGAQEFRLMLAPADAPSREHWRELVPEDPAERLVDVNAFARHVVVSLVRDAHQVLRITSLTSLLAGAGWDNSIDVTALDAGGLIDLGPNELFDTNNVVASVESYIRAPRWIAIDLDTGEQTTLKQDEVPTYDPDCYLIERRSVTARDGQEVPVTLVRHRDTPLDASAPLLLYGYGAYESSWWPGFERPLASLLDRGVVFAHAHVRGGGEGGRRWWLDGSMAAKHHTFEDFIDVADGLVSEGLVDGSRIVSRGLSAGGLLQGVVYSWRPDRWRAVVAEVPFVDVVTTMFDATIPLTCGEWDEWGDPRKPDEFAWLMAYSPYDNIPVGNRPDLLVTGSLHDPRVSVHEPAKWVARLRATDDGSGGGVLFRAETGEGGHTGPEGRFAALGYEAEITAYILAAMGLAGRHNS